MSSAARSVFVFGLYLLVTAAGLLLAPNLVLGPVGIPPTNEPWIRVVGVTVASLAVYYVVAARAEYVALMRATVWVRFGVLVAFSALVAAGIAPAPLIVFGVVDAFGAAWTWAALRSAPVPARR